MKSSKDKRKKRQTYIVDSVVENKRKVKEALQEKKIDFAVNTNWPFIGPFMRFFERAGIMKELKNITGSQIWKILAPHIFTLLYMLKIIIGIPKVCGSEALLGDLGAMNLVGFNVDSLRDGLSKRGDANQYGRGYPFFRLKMPQTTDI